MPSLKKCPCGIIMQITTSNENGCYTFLLLRLYYFNQIYASFGLSLEDVEQKL